MVEAGLGEMGGYILFLLVVLPMIHEGNLMRGEWRR